MRLSKRIVQVSWWEDLVPDHWWVELGLVPPVGRAMLRKVLSSLSADRWGCVPALLVVWPSIGAYRELGGQMVASRKARANEDSPELLLPVSLSPQ